MLASTMARNMTSFRFDIGSEGLFVLVTVHNASAPSTEDWAEWVVVCEQALKDTRGDLASAGNLVVTDGGAPNSEQRTRITQVLADAYTQPRVAVVTDSGIVRVAARAFALFNRDTRVFAPAQFGEAVDHVRCPRSALPELLAKIEARSDAVFGRNSNTCLRAVRTAFPSR